VLLVRVSGPAAPCLVPGAGLAWLDVPPADLGRRDAHIYVTGAGCPRLQVRSVLQVLDLTLIGDLVRMTLRQDAPAFMQRLVEAVLRKRFQQIIDGMQIKRLECVCVEGGGENDAAAPSGQFQYFQSGESGHLDVEKYQIRVECGDILDGAFS